MVPRLTPAAASAKAAAMPAAASMAPFVAAQVEKGTDHAPGWLSDGIDDRRA